MVDVSEITMRCAFLVLVALLIFMPAIGQAQTFQGNVWQYHEGGGASISLDDEGTALIFLNCDGSANIGVFGANFTAGSAATVTLVSGTRSRVTRARTSARFVVDIAPDQAVEFTRAMSAGGDHEIVVRDNRDQRSLLVSAPPMDRQQFAAACA